MTRFRAIKRELIYLGQDFIGLKIRSAGAVVVVGWVRAAAGSRLECSASGTSSTLRSSHLYSTTLSARINPGMLVGFRSEYITLNVARNWAGLRQERAVWRLPAISGPCPSLPNIWHAMPILSISQTSSWSCVTFLHASDRIYRYKSVAALSCGLCTSKMGPMS